MHIAVETIDAALLIEPKSELSAVHAISTDRRRGVVDN